MLDMNSFDAISIGLASPELIRSWSRGEVKKPETIDYRTLMPEPEGLFCEKIFGPQKDWECRCGKYKRVRYRGIVCDRCGVKITRAKVRRERMGHIELAASVSHIWYFKGSPSRMGLLLDMSLRELEKVLYFDSYVVIDPVETILSKKQLLTEQEYREYREKYDPLFKAGKGFKAEMGAEAVKKLLDEINPDELASELRDELKNSSGQKKVWATRRLETVEAFRQSGNHPSWMILDVIPVIPPDIRPIVPLGGNRFATSDLNDLYRRVINRNNRLKRLLDLEAPVIIVRNEKRMLQEAVDALIDNGSRDRPVTGPGNRSLKALSDMLKGKQGCFRQNLTGKRVDYSGRSVIVPGPEFKLYQCGLPKEMALELFKPFVMKQLVNKGLAYNIKSAKRMVEKVRPEVWNVLEEVIKDHPVLLNHAPTVNRLGVQAFEPVLVKGKSIRINPLLCSAFNADFDGDQMTVHVPLSAEAEAEARMLMLASQNILNPKDGHPVVTPTQDMVLGCYYLTLEKEGARGEGRVYIDPEEALSAYSLGFLDLQARILVRVSGFKGSDFVCRKKYLLTTVGKIIFNEVLPVDYPYINNADFSDSLPEANFISLHGLDPKVVLKRVPLNIPIKKDFIGELVLCCYRKYGNSRTAEILDGIKRLGFHYATRAGVTVAIGDIVIPPNKQKILQRAEGLVRATEENFQRRLITRKERYDRVIEIWSRAQKELTHSLMEGLDKLNPIFMMAHCGALNKMQITQLAGRYGLVAEPTGQVIDRPIKTNLREGFTALEYFISTYSIRKNMVDDALKTADSGYFTRRLVDAVQDVIIHEDDCGTRQGFNLSEYLEHSNNPEEAKERLVGRLASEPVYHPGTGEVIVDRNEIIDVDTANEILSLGISEVCFRTVLTCRSRHGICAKCYGCNPATGKIVDVGEAVGMIAAQSIGEFNLQRAMVTFNTGGVASDDITLGLPRLEELFEARQPKRQSLISKSSGIVDIQETGYERELRVISEHEDRIYPVPYGARLKVEDGWKVRAGDELTEGFINLHELLKVKEGVRKVQLYLLREVQRVFRTQGFDINDKHIEVIIRQMLKKVKVEDPGDTELLTGEIIDRYLFGEINGSVRAEGGRPARARPLLLGITKLTLVADSFLATASFQEITRVLTNSSIKGRRDRLQGLKENVIVGKLIHAGTGMSRYRNIKVQLSDETKPTPHVVGELGLNLTVS